MLVDDEKDTFVALKLALELAGFEVHGFTDPIDALMHIKLGCRDCKLLLTDVRMPRMSGYELGSRVKSIRPDMKVVIMTAFDVDLPALYKALPTFPADNVIRKPLLPSKLAEIIKPLYACGNS
jgi:DNA-binding NtrC family response regulator